MGQNEGKALVSEHFHNLFQKLSSRGDRNPHVRPEFQKI